MPISNEQLISIIQSGYDAQQGRSTDWNDRVLNPYARRGHPQARGNAETLIAKAYECGVKVSIDGWERPYRAFDRRDFTFWIDLYRSTGQPCRLIFNRLPYYKNRVPPQYWIDEEPFDP